VQKPISPKNLLDC